MGGEIRGEGEVNLVFADFGGETRKGSETRKRKMGGEIRGGGGK